ncbi:MAG: beta-ketoacyl-[acyl-carrier-protein] synthase II, partial [Candidatus Aminicenantes bacterium]|nr:beta-ketoacyl-[acyl-carrier-protein] synthase II [Candidatus Aminicenantes bacterium]
MDEQRVVVTGLGVVTPIGLGIDEFWEGLKEGRNGVSEITHFDPTDYRSQMAAEVKDFDPSDWIDGKSVERMDRFVHFGMASSVMALNDAGLNTFAFDGNRAGVIIGSGIGGAITIQDGYSKLHEKGPKSINPFFVSKTLINMAACLVSIT